MKTSRMSAREAAKYLVNEGIPVEEYQKLQDKRRESLALFQERRIKILISEESKLIEYGEMVLKHMKRLTPSKSTSKE